MSWKTVGTIVLAILGWAFTKPSKPSTDDVIYEQDEIVKNEQKKNNCIREDSLYEQNERSKRNEKINNCKKEDF